MGKRSRLPGVPRSHASFGGEGIVSAPHEGRLELPLLLLGNLQIVRAQGESLSNTVLHVVRVVGLSAQS